MTSAVASRPVIAAWWQLPFASVLLVVAFMAAGAQPRLLPLAFIAAVTPALCASDVLARRLPNRLVLPGYLVGIVGAMTQWVWTGQPPFTAIVAGGAYFAFMLAFGVAGGMGMGDVKLAGVLGIAAGLLGPVPAIASPVAAFVLGGLAALVALRRASGSTIPFGPFMLAGFWIAVALGTRPAG